MGGEEIGVVVEAGPQAGDQQGREHEQQGGDEQRDAGWPLGHVQRDRSIGGRRTRGGRAFCAGQGGARAAGEGHGAERFVTQTLER